MKPMENDKLSDASENSRDRSSMKRKVFTSLEDRRKEDKCTLADLEEFQEDLVAEIVNNSECDKKLVNVDDITLHKKHLRSLDPMRESKMSSTFIYSL